MAELTATILKALAGTTQGGNKAIFADPSPTTNPVPNILSDIVNGNSYQPPGMFAPIGQVAQTAAPQVPSPTAGPTQQQQVPNTPTAPSAQIQAAVPANATSSPPIVPPGVMPTAAPQYDGSGVGKGIAQSAQIMAALGALGGSGTQSFLSQYGGNILKSTRDMQQQEAEQKFDHETKVFEAQHQVAQQYLQQAQLENMMGYRNTEAQARIATAVTAMAKATDTALAALWDPKDPQGSAQRQQQAYAQAVQNIHAVDPSWQPTHVDAQGNFIPVTDVGTEIRQQNANTASAVGQSKVGRANMANAGDMAKLLSSDSGFWNLDKDSRDNTLNTVEAAMHLPPGTLGDPQNHENLSQTLKDKHLLLAWAQLKETVRRDTLTAGNAKQNADAHTLSSQTGSLESGSIIRRNDAEAKFYTGKADVSTDGLSDAQLANQRNAISKQLSADGAELLKIKSSQNNKVMGYAPGTTTPMLAPEFYQNKINLQQQQLQQIDQEIQSRAIKREAGIKQQPISPKVTPAGGGLAPMPVDLSTLHSMSTKELLNTLIKKVH